VRSQEAPRAPARNSGRPRPQGRRLTPFAKRQIATCGPPGASGQVEAIQVHHLVPGRNEVTNELSPASRRCRRPRRRPGAASWTRRPGRSGTCPLALARLAGRDLRTGHRLPSCSHSRVESRRFTKKSLVSIPGRSVKRLAASLRRRPRTRIRRREGHLWWVSVRSAARWTSSALPGATWPAAT